MSMRNFDIILMMMMYSVGAMLIVKLRSYF